MRDLTKHQERILTKWLKGNLDQIVTTWIPAEKIQDGIWDMLMDRNETEQLFLEANNFLEELLNNVKVVRKIKT